MELGEGEVRGRPLEWRTEREAEGHEVENMERAARNLREERKARRAEETYGKEAWRHLGRKFEGNKLPKKGKKQGVRGTLEKERGGRGGAGRHGGKGN